MSSCLERCLRSPGPQFAASLLFCVLSAARAAGVDDPAATFDNASQLLQRGRFEEAARLSETLSAEAGRSGKPALQAQALLQLAEAYRALGHLQRAEVALGQALAIPGLDPALAAGALRLRGNLAQLAGDPAQARKALEDSVELAAGLGRGDLHAAALNDLGNLFAALEQNDAAARAYAEAIALAAKAANAAQEGLSTLNAARLAFKLGDADRALREAKAAERLLVSLPASHEKAFSLLSLGELYMRMREQRADAALSAAAFETLQQARTIAESLGDPRILSYALGYTGHLYELESRAAEAAVPTRRAMFLAQQINAPELLYRWHWQYARLLLAQGAEDGAIASYRSAIGQLQSVRQDLAASYSSGTASYRTIVAPLYFELADLLLKRSKSAEAPQVQRLLTEARDIVEQSKSAELQDYFQDNCVAAQRSRVAQVGSVGARTAVIYPVMLKDRLELLVGFEGEMKQVTVAVKAQALVEAIRAFRPLLERRTTRGYLPHAQRLYDYLLRPLEAELAARQVDTLVFVPDGALRTIPMSVLHDGRDFAIARYAMATTPGLTLTDPQPLLARKLNVLANGLTLPVQGFSRLPNVGAELDSVHRLHGGTLLRDQDYILGNLEREMEKQSYNVVHIASHAQFQSDPKQTFLLTFDSKLTMDLLEKLIAPSRYREQPIELLALSACQTAAGDDRAALGLAGVAIKAGARSALASLWFINDQSSTLLISEFYRNLQGQNLSKAKALQQAQLKLLADNRFRHPGYWGPFLLIGNWL